MSKETTPAEAAKNTPATVPAPTPAPLPEVKSTDELVEERALRAIKAVKASILEITPKGLEALAENCISRGLSLDDARKEFLAEVAKRQIPVGTPEPAAPAKKEPDAKAAPSNDVLLRSVCAPKLY